MTDTQKGIKRIDNKSTKEAKIRSIIPLEYLIPDKTQNEENNNNYQTVE
jgi:hypothetical protein